jgi:hypothetical protein
MQERATRACKLEERCGEQRKQCNNKAYGCGMHDEICISQTDETEAARTMSLRDRLMHKQCATAAGSLG